MVDSIVHDTNMSIKCVKLRKNQQTQLFLVLINIMIVLISYTLKFD